MSVESRVEELRARVSLAAGTATVLLVVAPTDAELDELRGLLIGLLRATPLVIEDLGRGDSHSGPARWAEQTSRAEAEAYVQSFTAPGMMETRAFAQVLNSERSLLRELGGPLVLLVSRSTEQVLRMKAHDFFTWIAQAYELPEPESLRVIVGRLGVELPDLDCKSAVPEEPVRFLHISDLHLRPDRVKRYDQDRVLRGLLEYLQHDRQAFPIDLVFVTGDLAHGGRPEEYELVVELFERLAAATRVPLDRFYVVPGNHDVDRRPGRWLLRTLDDDSRSIEFFEELDARRFHREKLLGYERAMRGLLGEHRTLGLGVGFEAVEVVEVRGARLAVVSFNSAWFSQDDGDQGKLWVGEPGVARAIDRIADEEAEFAVALLHHPFEYLHERERDLVERWLERGIDLVLRGHLHTDRTRSIVSQRGGYVEVAAPAAYQGSQWGNGCFLGEIRVQARTVRLRPLTYASGPDPWVLDTKVFPSDEDDGYCGTFTVPQKQRERSGVAAPRRAAVEAAYRKVGVRKQEQAHEVVRGMRGRVSSRPEQDTLFELGASPSLRAEVLGPDDGVALVEAIAQAKTEPLEIEDLASFEQVLLHAGRVFLRAVGTVGIPYGRLTEPTVRVGFAAAIGALVSAPVAVDPQPLGRSPIDILVGRQDMRSHISIRRGHGEPEQVNRWISEVQGATKHLGAKRIALVSFSDEPRVPTTQQVTTDSGELVVIALRL